MEIRRPWSKFPVSHPLPWKRDMRYNNRGFNKPYGVLQEAHRKNGRLLDGTENPVWPVFDKNRDKIQGKGGCDDMAQKMC